MAYDGLLLDYDGVVVRVLTADERRPAFRETLADRCEVDGEIVDSLAHSVSPDQLEALSERTGLDPETLWRHRDDALSDVLQRAALDRRKRPYGDVDALFDLDVPLGIVSNNQKRVVEFIADEYGLREQFETICAREPHPESLRRKKPEPTFLEAAVADLGVENPLYVGDKESDILAGERTGLDTVLLRRSHNAERAIDREPTYEVNSLERVVDIVRS